MDIKELLDDDAFEKEKLFNSEEYNTLIIGREGLSSKENSTADLIESLIGETDREKLDLIYSRLKDLNARALLVEGIRTCTRDQDKAALAAACWESGLDFSDYFAFFTTLALSADFKLAMEAVTVIENCEGPVASNILRSSLQMAESSASHNTILVQDLITHIKSRLNAV
jgi:hypothetical protein